MVDCRQRDWWTLLHWSWDMFWYTHCVSVPIFPPIHSPTFSTQLSAWRLTCMQHINRAGCPLAPAGLASGEPQQAIWVRKSERKVIISLDLSLSAESFVWLWPSVRNHWSLIAHDSPFRFQNSSHLPKPLGQKLVIAPESQALGYCPILGGSFTHNFEIVFL